MPNRFEKPGIGFLDLAVSQLKKAKTFLDDVERIVDWAPIEKLLKKKLRRNQDAAGNPAYPPLGMFKVLLLQRWYNLSDQGMDDARPTAYPSGVLWVFPLITIRPTPPPSAASAIT